MNFKRTLALVLAAIMLLIGVTGCGKDTTYIAELDGEKLPVGVYIFALIDSYVAGLNNLRDNGITLEKPDELLKQKIDDMDATQWITNETVKVVKQYIAINKKFDEMGFTLSESQLAQLATSLKETMTNNGEYFEKNGIGEAAVKMVMETSFKMTTLFDKYYAEGGLEEVPNADLMKYFSENYAKAAYFGTYITDMTDEQKAEAKTRYEGFAERLNNGEDFITVLGEEEKSKLTAEQLETYEPDNTRTIENFSDIIIKGDTTYYVPEFIDAVFGAEYGKYFFADIAPAYFVITRIDISENQEVFEQHKADVLYALKNKDFEKLVEGWEAEYKVELNQDAVDKFTAKTLKLS